MNQITRIPPGSMPAVGTRDGSWVWDGSNWVCDPDCLPPAGCPPFGPPVFSGPAGQPPWYPGANGGVSFGATAPPNPVRGHFWWNGSTLWLFDGAAWVDIGGGGGAATGTQPPANPVAGQDWFDGQTLWVWSGSSWVAIGPSGGTIASPNPYQVVAFTTPGTFSFTVPSDVTTQTTFKFRMQAGGGGGGGAASTWSGQGGGGGEFKEIAAVGLTAGLIVSCTVPAGGAGGTGGADGAAGADAEIFIANINTTIIAKGGAGGWGDAQSTNTAGQGLGGSGGTFTPGTGNIMLVQSIPGGDAHFGVDINDAAIGGAGSFLGFGGPSFNNAIGWNDTTNARGYGAGGRGAYNFGDPGGNGRQGLIVLERFKN
jgi:hypothetical protein